MTDNGLDYTPAEHYDRVTSAWQMLLGDELHYGVFDEGNESLQEATAALTALMIDGADLAPGLDVLDVGCGSGAPACQLVGEFGVRVVGITTSGVGIAAARQRAASLGLRDAAFEQRDGTDNQLPDNSFDRVWVLESSHLMRERDRLVAECARVLRPGGRVILCDLVKHRDIGFQEVRDRREEFAVLRAAFGDAHMHSLAYYSSAFAAAGLEVERVLDLTEATLPTFDRWRENARIHHDSVVSLIGAEGLEAFVRSCDILESLWRDGTFGYGLVVAIKPS